MVDGATARSGELGWTIDVQAPASEGDFQAFVTTVQQLLEKGVEAISINPIGTDSAVTAVKAANEKGVPILAHNFITPFSEGEVMAYIGYDQWGGAEKLAAHTCETRWPSAPHWPASRNWTTTSPSCRKNNRALATGAWGYAPVAGNS